MAHTELGLKLLHRLAEDMLGLAAVEAEPKVDGRNMVMVLAPSKSRARVVPVREDDGLGLPDDESAEALQDIEQDSADIGSADVVADEEQVEA